VFFLSSRRRHTRSKRDWSSDVCSSDLDHTLAQCSSVSLTDVAEETWIVGRPGTTYHQLVMANCASAGFTPHIGHYANEWETGMRSEERRVAREVRGKRANESDAREVNT